MKTLNFTQLRRLFITMLILLVCAVAAAQDTTRAKTQYKVVNNEIVRVTPARVKTPPTITEYTFTIKDIVYPVYKSSRGSYFIIRVAKKSGKTRKQYFDKAIFKN